RLLQVTDASGDFAVYRYDSVGNVLAIDRRGVDAVAVSGFTPAGGGPGTRVHIIGGGFDLQPDSNVVCFNGAAAIVDSATPNELVAVVPSSATTGPIGVETERGFAFSASAFTVKANDGSPTITSFAPAIGSAGTPLAIQGTNFVPSPAGNRIDLNGRVATP